MQCGAAAPTYMWLLVSIPQLYQQECRWTNDCAQFSMQLQIQLALQQHTIALGWSCQLQMEVCTAMMGSVYNDDGQYCM
jgi:hypothetical protein